MLEFSSRARKSRGWKRLATSLTVYMVAIGCASSGAISSAPATRDASINTAPGAISPTGDLEARLRRIVEDQLTERGGRLTQGGREQLESFIRRGAETVTREGATAERIAQAEINARSLADRLADAAVRASPTPTIIIVDEVVVHQAMAPRAQAGLCPIYPFC